MITNLIVAGNVLATVLLLFGYVSMQNDLIRFEKRLKELDQRENI